MFPDKLGTRKAPSASGGTTRLGMGLNVTGSSPPRPYIITVKSPASGVYCTGEVGVWGTKFWRRSSSFPQCTPDWRGLRPPLGERTVCGVCTINYNYDWRMVEDMCCGIRRASACVD